MVIRPIILCGGSGTRLWPLSREDYPKQFIDLLDGESLIQSTMNRVKNLGTPLFVTNEAYRFLLKEETRQLPDSVILLEPKSRNTAAAIACACFLPTLENDDVLVFLPADHYLPDIEKFQNHIKVLANQLQDNQIGLLGIKPNYPSTAYGYIKADIHSIPEGGCYRVLAFIEKPDVKTAHQFLSNGLYFWNAGIFIGKKKAFIQAFKECAPDILSQANVAMLDLTKDLPFVRPDGQKFEEINNISVDYAVMERYQDLRILPFEGVWSDVGTWSSYAELLAKDEHHNIVKGDIHLHNCSNSMVISKHRKVLGVGIQDLTVVDTKDALLVASTDQLDQLKVALKGLADSGLSDLLHAGLRVYRPWGWYETIEDGANYKVKIIQVNPGASLSLQSHQYRSEHWVVVKGIAKVTNGNNVLILNENESTFIHAGEKHRLENTTQGVLQIIEVQVGGYLGEDDIIRYDDKYGRNS